MPSASPAPREPRESNAAAARREAILQAAAVVFLRYGYRKTSMDDLARAAGLSRQGLYLHFPTKDAIFRETVVLLTAKSLQAVQTALADDRGSIEDRLLDAFVGLASHDDGTPISRELLVELIATATVLAGPAVAAFDDALLAAVVRALCDSGVARASKTNGISAKDLARHLLAASNGIKQTVRTAVEYREQMRVAVRLVCRC
jgi:AcrR family transcriptional regulator